MCRRAGLDAVSDGHIHGCGTRAANYVLTALLASYVLPFAIDRPLGGGKPQMKPELGISDTAFGLLTGFGFALLYTLVGIPVAQLAETRRDCGSWPSASRSGRS